MKKLFNDNEIYKIVDFITDYNDKNINSEQILDVYGVDVEHLNTREALDTFMNHIEETDLIDVKELWGADLYLVFGKYIDKKGWLTSYWPPILEREISKYDKDYNDHPLYKSTYSRMYNLEFESKDRGKLIRPIKED